MNLNFNLFFYFLFLLSAGLEGANFSTVRSIFNIAPSSIKWFDYVKTGNLDKVIKYINEGIDVNQRDQDGNSALDLAVSYKQNIVLDTLLAEEKVVIPANSLHFYLNNQPIFEKFFRVPRININYVDRLGQNILHLAIVNYKFEIVRMLIEDPRLDVNSVDLDRNTALHKIVTNRFDNDELISKLINRHDINLNLINKDGFTPLYLAITHSRIEMAKDLLRDSRISVNLEIPIKKSALHVAIKKGLIEIVQLLIAAHADLDFKAEYGGYSETPLEYAHRFGNQEIITALENAATGPILK